MVVDVPPTIPGKAVEVVHKIVADIIRAIGDDPGPLDFFTDGSWKKAGGPINSVFCPESVILQASAALVIIRRDDNWKELQMISVALTNGEDSLPGSVYPMELLGLSIALKVAEMGNLDAHFYSDSTSAIQAIKQPHRIRYQANKSNLLLLKAATGKAKNIHHVRAHPEKVQTAKSLWTRHMMGNHIADRTAVEDYSTLTQLQETARITRLTYTVEDSLKALTYEECYYWANEKGTPTLQTFQEIIDNLRCSEYAAKRDMARMQRNEEPKWSGRSYQHAALCAELQHRNKGDRARLLRIMWDLYYHGGTQKKFDGKHEGLCNLCSLPDSAEHWMIECRAGDINTPPISYRTALGYELEEYLQGFEDQQTMEYKLAKGLVEASYDINDTYAYHIYLGQLSASQTEKIALQMGISSLNENERKKLQQIAVDIGKIFINYVIKQYVYKRSNGKKEATDGYFAKHIKRVQQYKLKKKAKGHKRQEKLIREKEVKTAAHARSYIDLHLKSLRQRPLDYYLLKAGPPTRLGCESGID